MSSAEILLVEDDMDIREGVRILLEGEGYHVSEAENGRAGLSMLTEATDLVILDIMMPGMSGLRTCEEIRKVSTVPILFLTAKAQEASITPEGRLATKDVTVRLIPYYAWNHRGAGRMDVWLARSLSGLED